MTSCSRQAPAARVHSTLRPKRAVAAPLLPTLPAAVLCPAAGQQAALSHLQSMYGSTRERQLASPKPKRPVGLAAAARIVTPGHLAVTFGRK